MPEKASLTNRLKWWFVGVILRLQLDEVDPKALAQELKLALLTRFGPKHSRVMGRKLVGVLMALSRELDTLLR